MDDCEIIELFFQRDERALSETSGRYGGMCCRLAKRILGSQEDAEECCNDVLLKLWNAIPPDRPQRFAAYLVRVVRNTALDLYEKLHAAKRGGTQTAVALDELAECLPAPDDVEEAQSAAETGEMLNRFLADLPDQTRNIFVLRYVYLMPVKDIAAKTGVSVSKVKVVLHRTRNALKKWMGGEIP
ncbi:MAG: sigma-70 family RNA polymerase sigma factor [Oscillospiraceae bacterium]|nr:sigma-70 family RNA polymerase sigma factor [Oscillospiraceae bacterium]